MKVTVCELPNAPDQLDIVWLQFAEHTQWEKSDLVLLPEMIFSPWLAGTDQVDPDRWQQAVKLHDTWMPRLAELDATTVIGSRPIMKDGIPYNAGFVWEDGKFEIGHAKTYLPDEERFWEATWYRRGPKEFIPFETQAVKIGFLICTELWFSHHARDYGKQGVQILVNPRATELFSVKKWIAGGQAAAVIGGMYCISSNHGGIDHQGIHWGGTGWVIDPDGEVLGRTSSEKPFITIEIDLEKSTQAQHTYPRYVIG